MSLVCCDDSIFEPMLLVEEVSGLVTVVQVDLESKA